MSQFERDSIELESWLSVAADRMALLTDVTRGYQSLQRGNASAVDSQMQRLLVSDSIPTPVGIFFKNSFKNCPELLLIYHSFIQN